MAQVRSRAMGVISVRDVGSTLEASCDAVPSEHLINRQRGPIGFLTSTIHLLRSRFPGALTQPRAPATPNQKKQRPIRTRPIIHPGRRESSSRSLSGPGASRMRPAIPTKAAAIPSAASSSKPPISISYPLLVCSHTRSGEPKVSLSERAITQADSSWS